MTLTFTIESLAASHDRKAFSCGVPPLDRYLHELATQDMRRRVSTCFVALDAAGTIAAYYTFAATSFPLAGLPPELTKRLPRYAALPAGLTMTYSPCASDYPQLLHHTGGHDRRSLDSTGGT